MSEEMERKIEQKQRGNTREAFVGGAHSLVVQNCPPAPLIHEGWPGILLVQSPRDALSVIAQCAISQPSPPLPKLT